MTFTLKAAENSLFSFFPFHPPLIVNIPMLLMMTIPPLALIQWDGLVRDVKTALHSPPPPPTHNARVLMKCTVSAVGAADSGRCALMA